MENHYVRYLFSSTGKYVILAFFSLQICFLNEVVEHKGRRLIKNHVAQVLPIIDDVRSVVHWSNRATQVIYGLTFCAISSPYLVNNNSGLILS